MLDEFLGQFLQEAYIIFEKGVDNFEIEHETCIFLVRGAVSPLEDKDYQSLVLTVQKKRPQNNVVLGLILTVYWN